MTALWFFLGALVLAAVGDYFTRPRHPTRPVGRHTAEYFAAKAEPTPDSEILPGLMEVPA